MAQTTFRKNTELNPRTVSSNEAKQKWGAMIRAVSEEGEEIIIESHGKPKTAMISFEEYQEVQELREKQRRAELLKRFDALQRRLETKNQDLTQEQADELANRFSREFIDDLAAEGKLRFQRDQK